LQRPTSAGAHDVLFRQIEIDGMSLAREFPAKTADLLEKGNGSGRTSVDDRLLQAGVVQLLPRTDSRATDIDVGDDRTRVERDLPQHRRSQLIRQQARCAFTEHGRMQRNARIRKIESLAARLEFFIECRSGFDEGRDIGNCVADEKTVAFGCDVQRLVEVTAAGRIDRDEWDVTSIEIG
jgi:hypothetical protein